MLEVELYALLQHAAKDAFSLLDIKKNMCAFSLDGLFQQVAP